MAEPVTMVYTPTDQVIAELSQGVGMNLLYYPRPYMPQRDEEAGWQVYLADLDDLRPGWIRFGLYPHYFFDKQSAFLWQTDAVDALARVDRWCGRTGAKIMLDFWYVPKHLQVPGNGYNGPADLAEYAERFVVPAVRGLIEQVCVTNVNFLSLMNEPLWEGHPYAAPDGQDPYVWYTQTVQTVRRALDAAGYGPDRLPLIGPGCMGLARGWPDEFVLRDLPLAESLGAIDAHHYHAHFDHAPRDADRWTIPMSHALSYVERGVRYAQKMHRPYHITELASFYYGKGSGKSVRGTNPDAPGYHEVGMLDAEFIVRCLPLGVGGFLRWSFNDTLDPGFWLVRDGARGHERHPNTYPLYRQLMRSTARGASVLKVKHPWWPPESYPHLHEAALKLPDGHVTLLLVNDADVDCFGVEWHLPKDWADRQWHKICTDRLDKCRLRPAAVEKGVLRDVVTPLSVNVYTTRDIETVGA